MQVLEGLKKYGTLHRKIATTNTRLDLPYLHTTLFAPNMLLPIRKITFINHVKKSEKRVTNGLLLRNFADFETPKEILLQFQGHSRQFWKAKKKVIYCIFEIPPANISIFTPFTNEEHHAMAF